MNNTITPSPDSKWFARLDNELKPTSLMLYNFIGAKFEAHCISLNNSEELLGWIEKIYHFEHVRQIFEQIVFDAEYPQPLFDKFLAELCRIRNRIIENKKM